MAAPVLIILTSSPSGATTVKGHPRSLFVESRRERKRIERERMQLKLLHCNYKHCICPAYAAALPTSHHTWNVQIPTMAHLENQTRNLRRPLLPLKLTSWRSSSAAAAVATQRFLSISASFEPLDLTEDNVKRVLSDSRAELGQIFDTSVGMTGVVELAELDGPFVKISLRGRFWHERSMVLARVGNYLKQRIPEILEVDIEDEKQLDDSPENF